MDSVAQVIAELVEDNRVLTRRLQQTETELEKQRDNADHWKSRFQELAEANATEATGVTASDGFGT